MNELDRRLQTIEDKASRQRRYIVYAALLAFVVNAAFFWFVFQRPAPSPLVTVNNMHSDGPAVLCSGDTLGYGYSLSARERAVVEVSTTTLRTTPEVVQYGGDVAHDGFPAAMTVAYTQTWTVPADALPGDYVRLVAVTAPGRVMQPAFGTLAFKVTACAGDAK